jgi:hypothetical protein
LIGGLGTLVLLAVCGLSTVLVVMDERQGLAGRTGPPPASTALPRDISSRQVDPAPLTVTEVFPTPELRIGPEEEPYRVLKTEAIDDCRTAVTGDLGPLLHRLGCDQVVRGTLRPPDGAYLATAGVFNLPDSADALRAHRDAKPVIEAQRGRFHGMVAGTGTEPVMLSSAQVGWHVRGHYLVYGVIARADGAPIAADDPIARQILYDLVQLHLRDEVLGRRASLPVRPGTGTVTTSRSTSAGG